MVKNERVKHIDEDYVGKVFDPDVDKECQNCLHRAPGFCPCTTIEIIPVSDKEVDAIRDSLNRDHKC